MTEPYMNKQLPNRIIFALMLGAIFIIAGKLIPDLYFRYFDTTEYYTVAQPVPVNKKWYKPCESVILTSTRNSAMNLSLNVNVNLILKRGDEDIFFVPDVNISRIQTAKAGNYVTVQTSYPLPCDLKDGLYYWQIVATYHVYGYERTYLSISDTFNVNELGLDPNIVKQATASASLTVTPRRVTPEPLGRPAIVEMRTTPGPTTAQVNQNDTPTAGSSGTQSQTVNVQQPPAPTAAPQPTPAPTASPAICILGICIP